MAIGCAVGVRFNLQWADKRSQIDYDTHRRGQLVRDFSTDICKQLNMHVVYIHCSTLHREGSTSAVVIAFWAAVQYVVCQR
jgi:hypothetical protein